MSVHPVTARVERILDALFVMAEIMALGTILVLEDQGRPLELTVLLCAMLACAVFWVLRRHARVRGEYATMGFLVASVVGLSVSDGPATLPLVWLALLITVTDLGLRWAWSATAVVIVLVVWTMWFQFRQPLAAVVIQAVGVLFVLMFGLLYAVLFRDLDRAVRERDLTMEDLVLAKERARSARELHDGLGQRLTAICMSLDFARRVRDTTPDRAWEEVETARAQATDSLADVRRWVRALHPVAVTEMTSAEAFNAVADSFRGSGLDVQIRQTGEGEEMSRDLALLCHRVVQEGLTNVLKHANATTVEIDLDVSEVGVCLTVTDDGEGPQTPGHEGFGLRSIRERAEAAGGFARFGARADARGAVLQVKVPKVAASSAAVGEKTATDDRV